MQTNITARHFGLSENMKVYFNDKLVKLGKYSPKIEEVRSVFSKEKLNYVCEITLTGKRFRIAAVDKDDDLRASFDKACQNAEKQLKRFRDKVKDRKSEGILSQELNIISSAKKKKAAAAARIIRSAIDDNKPMSPEEAALELEVLNKEFIVFINAETENMNVLYKRTDGNYGLIES